MADSVVPHFANDAGAEKITIGDRTWLISFRFKRIYKPYTVQLIDFTYGRSWRRSA